MTDHFADAGKPMPDALRLADELDGCAYSIPADKRGWTDDGRPQNTCTDAAAELRRLHDENEALKAAQYECGFGAGCCYQAAKSEADEVLLRQALEALELGVARLRFAAITALMERLIAPHHGNHSKRRASSHRIRPARDR